MTIEEMKRRKISLGMTNEEIAIKAGIPLSTIQKIMGGVTKAPRKNTIDAIEEVIVHEERLRQEKFGGYRYTVSPSPGAMEVHDSSPADASWPRQHSYTIEDYYKIPDERRVELIDGVIYDMAVPSVIHQKILGELHILFRECMDAHGEGCEVYLSPCDVRLDSDNRTMVQPDLLVICREYDLGARAFEGAPDLTVEILSPSTRSKDMLLKLYKYYNAGVKEYWIIDPEKERVTVYDFREDNLDPVYYDFDAVIPIGISGGQCEIDFSRIHRALEKVRRR